MSEKICPFCGDDTEDYPNDGYAHYDCIKDFETSEVNSHIEDAKNYK